MTKHEKKRAAFGRTFLRQSSFVISHSDAVAFVFEMFASER